MAEGHRSAAGGPVGPAENRVTDPQLPQMGIALDASAMAAVLERECLQPSDEFELRGCRIDYVRYKPGRNCVICYELAIHDRKRDSMFRHLLCGRVYENDSRMSMKRWRRAAREPLAPVPFGF